MTCSGGQGRWIARAGERASGHERLRARMQWGDVQGCELDFDTVCRNTRKQSWPPTLPAAPLSVSIHHAARLRHRGAALGGLQP